MAQLKSTSVTGNLSVTGNVVASQIIKLNEAEAADKLLKADGDVQSLKTITNNISDALKRADDAYDLANTKTTMSAVENKGYATKAELNNTKTAILGKNNDNTDYNGTVKGAYEAAATKLPLSGGIIAGGLTVNDSALLKSTLTIGSSTQSVSPKVGIRVHDLRNLGRGQSGDEPAPWPGLFGDNSVNFYFDEINDSYGGGTAANRWMSIMHMKGWTGAYAAWELAGNAHSDSNQDTLRYRQGINNNWGEWQSVLTDANFTTYLDNTYLKLTGGALTGPLTINGKNIAFQATPNNFIDAGNEFNFIPTEYDGVIYINYKGKDGKTTGTRTDGSNKQITTYVFCNGRGDTTAHGSIEALSYNATSDARLKENFIPLTTQKSILDLPIYKFDFISGTKNQIGCKAQDLQEICPEIVNEDSDGYLSIQESKIVYLLIDEIRKLKGQINSLMKGGC